MSNDVNMLLQMIAELQGLSLCEDRMTFFYDETGNCGKFSLREGGVNDPTALNNDFILGGVAYVGDNCPVKPEELISKLKIQSDELKFKNIYKSKDFITFMGSHRASVYIDWLYRSGLYVHYAIINNLYFALVDMVDSLWGSQPQFLISQECVFQLKSALYNFCKECLNDTLSLLYRYSYPNIDKEKTQDFCYDFCDLIQKYNDDSTNRGIMVEHFRQMLKYAGQHGELVFLYDNESNVLVEEYYALYQSRCCTYKYAVHHFDYEKVILDKMQKAPIIENDNPFINYDFLDSKQNKMIQICDVFVGLMAKLFIFLDGVSFEEIERTKTEKNREALINFAKINALIDRSTTYHEMMFQNINDTNLVQQRMIKLEALVKAVNL